MRLSKVEIYVSRVLLVTVYLFVLGGFLRFLLVEVGQVQGVSMLPAYRDGDYFLSIKPFYLFWPPRRFDVVQTVLADGKKPYLAIKRVIGLPGETVNFVAGRVCVESGPDRVFCLAEPYLAPGTATAVKRVGNERVKVPPDSYFLLGDNRAESNDSRDFGPVHRRFVIGQVVHL